ncbi:MAG: SpoIID/LytB domain-containing protein [Acidimicrobiales bacterium]
MLAVLAALAGALVPSAPYWPSTAKAGAQGLGPAGFELSGYGFGHGRGMGQWGAYGYASVYGWSYQEILAHYYGGARLGELASPEPAVAVHLAELDGHNTIAQAVAGSSLVATWDGAPPERAVAFEVDRAGGDEVVLSGPGCAGPWKQLAVATGPVTIADAMAAASSQAPEVGSLLQACIPGIGARTYQGSLVSEQDGQTYNVVPLEDYVDGVVAAEAPVSWASTGGEAALEAQAVAARSYVMAILAGGGSPGSPEAICDTGSCQAYKGWPDQYGQTADSAVAATAGEVLYCVAGSACGPAGSIALAEYSASTGGYTAGGDFPPVPDLGDSVATNPFHTWDVAVTSARLKSLFPSVGAVEGLQVRQRNGLGALGGRVEELTVAGTQGSVSLSGSEFAAALGLPSNWFEANALQIAPPTSTPSVPATTVPGPSAGPGAPTSSPSPGAPADNGYWVVDAQGDVRAFGKAEFFGNAAGTVLAGQVTAMAATPDGGGYWLAGSGGGVLAFGDASWYGSASKLHLRQPVVSMAATPDGQGYWLVSKDGTVLAYGDARFYGPFGRLHLKSPVVSITATPDGGGYWLTASNGAVLAYGDARTYAPTGPVQLSQAVIGLVPSNDGRGYLLVTKNGGVLSFGDAVCVGSLPNEQVAAAVAAYGAVGYYMLSRSGVVYAFGQAEGFSQARSPDVERWPAPAVALALHR